MKQGLSEGLEIIRAVRSLVERGKCRVHYVRAEPVHFKNRQSDMQRPTPHPSVASPRGGACAAGAFVASSRLPVRCVPALEVRRQTRPAFGWAKTGAVATSGPRGQVRPACPPVPSFVPSRSGVGLTLRSSRTCRQPASFLRCGAVVRHDLRRPGGRRAPQLRP